jgi:hypothetical protein
VLDLEPRVRLDEREAPGTVDVDEELEGSDPFVRGFARHAHRRFGERSAELRSEPGRGGDLDELLVPALERAVALAEISHGPAVADDLYLDVPRARPELLDVEVAAPERSARLRAAARPCGLERVRGAHRAHAASAAAGHRLHHHRRSRTQRVQEAGGLVERRGAVRPARDRHLAPRGELARRRLVAEERERLGAWADEAERGGRARAREVVALREEPVPGVHGVAAGEPRDADQRVDVEVGRNAAPAQCVNDVDVAEVERRRVVLGVHADRLDPELGGRARDPDRDLSAIGDQHTSQAHRLPVLLRSSRNG